MWRGELKPDVTADMTGGRIVVVDDNDTNLLLMARLLQREGHTVWTGRSGDDALALAARARPDLVLLDVMMPGRDGFETCRTLKEQAATRLIPVVLVTALHDSANKIRGLEAGADDFITKPVSAPELCARVRSLVRLKRYTDDLDSAQSVFFTLGRTIETRDAYTEGHCERLAAYAVMLGREIGLDFSELAILDRGGFLHDIGKIGIPDAVLLKAAALTRDEYDVVKQHTIIGDQLCSEMRSLSRVRSIVRNHHERLDGSGYPDGLAGDDIPLNAQIIAIVDVYDALTTARPYKQAFGKERAYETLRSEVQRGWRRSDLVEAFITAEERRLSREAYVRHSCS